MVGSNKVLTVSYGTFSCTLEGFEDSFDTMKAIAEYFRDLAADDRYFGAEPPTPDAEMLARIAEREIARRVEAWQERDRIVLRAEKAVAEPSAPEVVAPAAQAPAPAAQQAPAPAAQQAPAPSAQAAVAQAVVEDVAPAPAAKAPQPTLTVSAPAPQPQPQQAAAPDPVAMAAKLERIRAVVSREPEAPAAAVVPVVEEIAPLLVEDEEYLEDQHAEELDLDTPLPMEDAEAPTLLAAATAWDEGSEIDLGLLEEDATLPEVGVEDAFLEDEQPEEDATFDADEEAAIEARAPVGSGLAPLAADQEPKVENSEGDDDLDAILDRLMTKASAKPAEPQIEAESDDAPLEAVQPVRARVLKVKKADLEAAIRRGAIEEAPEDEGNAVAEAPAAVASSLSDEEEAELARELAEVEAEIADTTEEDFTFDELDEDDDEQVDSLFAERQDDLQEEDFDDEDFEDEAYDDEDFEGDDFDDEPEAAQSATPAAPHFADANADRDVMRLMAKTISEMDEPESTHRRSAIAHLRAAVAATKAEKQEGGVLKPEPAAAPYREDLASVVRPRRPVVSGGASTRRPGEDRPAPLKLVAEQRIDVPSASVGAGTVVPVRPRRVTVMEVQAPTLSRAPSQAQPAPQVDAPAGGFAEYASEKGVKSLAEVLEAAAAYLSFVEGRPEFSRPQLMNKARLIEGQEFSREDGLRHFGVLLRDGKIERLKGGRFTVSDRIGFQPDKRAAG
jgi:hypothetical protein